MASSYGIGTTAIHAGQSPNQWSHGAVIPPICLASTFSYTAQPQDNIKYVYSRCGSPTRECLETALAALEGAKYGIAFSSGLAVQLTIVQTFVRSGEHIVCCQDCYGGTGRQFRTTLANMQIQTTFVDEDAASIVRAIIPGKTKLLWIESPTNPSLRVIDLKAVHDEVKKIDENIIYVVDNTFMSSVLQKPLKFGADIVTHSLSKYINGHSDVVMGCLVTSNEELYNKLKFQSNAMGTVPSPFDCFLVNRGLKTLHLRMERHSTNALAVAQFLGRHPKVKSVIYLGLESHPQHELAVKQSEGKGLSGVVCFYVKTSDPNATYKMASSLKVFTLAESLGAVESIVGIPCIMSHSSHPVDVRKRLGIDDSFVRLSVGIEDVTDLIEDLKQALDNVQ